MKNKSNKTSQRECPPWVKFSDNDLLSQMEMLFNIESSSIQSLWIESYEDARARTTTEWFDEDIGQYVQPWFLIPYRKTIDQDLLKTNLENAKTFIPILEEYFAKRELTVKFLHAWGAFNHAVGYVDAVYHSEGDDLGYDRSAESTRKLHWQDGRRKWIATVIVGLVDQRGLTRMKAEEKFVAYAQGVIKSGDFPPGTDEKWFRALLSEKNNNIVTTYDENHFTLICMREFIANSNFDIPPIPSELT